MKATLSALIFAIFAAVMVAAQHQPYYLISPTPGEPVAAGKDFRVEWLNGKDEDVTVYLLEGSGRENMLPTGYSVKGNGADGGVDFKIPADTDPKGRYALRIDYVSDKGRNAQAFSAAFQVTGGTPAEEKTEPTTTATPAATKTEEAKTEEDKTSAAAETTPAAKDDDKEAAAKDDEKDAAKDAEKDAAKDDEKDAAKESADATTTPEAQEEDEENSAVSVKFAAIMMAVPAIVAGAFLA